MLGRYVAVTLLILGAAMLLAPSEPATRLPTGEPAVARPPRAQVAERPVPSAVASAPPQAAAPVAVPAPEAAALPEEPTEAETQSAVEAAVAEALNLDMADSVPTMDDPAAFSDSFEPGLAPVPTPAPTAAPEAEDAAAAPEATVPAAPGPAAGETGRMFVTATRVNVRAGPATSFDVVGTVDYGEAVELLSYEGESWARIRFAGGTSGFVSRRFLAQDLNGG